jgi:hypothetical protein
MARPDAAYHVGWPAWREGDRVYVQERLFLRERLTGTFDPEFPEVHVGPRQELSEEGIRICQWEVAVRHLGDFVERQAAGQPVLPIPQPPSSGPS